MPGRYISAQKWESELLKIFTVQVHGVFCCAMPGVDDPGRLLSLCVSTCFLSEAMLSKALARGLNSIWGEGFIAHWMSSCWKKYSGGSSWALTFHLAKSARIASVLSMFAHRSSNYESRIIPTLAECSPWVNELWLGNNWMVEMFLRRAPYWHYFQTNRTHPCSANIAFFCKCERVITYCSVRGQTCHWDNGNLVFYCESLLTDSVMFMIAIA